MLADTYGWSTDEILDLTLARLRQAVADITKDKLSAIKREAEYLRILCSFIAATVPVEKGKESKLMEQATKIGKREKKQSGPDYTTQFFQAAIKKQEMREQESRH